MYFLPYTLKLGIFECIKCKPITVNFEFFSLKHVVAEWEGCESEARDTSGPLCLIKDKAFASSIKPAEQQITVL